MVGFEKIKSGKSFIFVSFLFRKMTPHPFISILRMKITKLQLKNYRQFKDLTLDFTYPQGHEKAGQPLRRVCFIGRNGTGKTTILEQLKLILNKLLTEKNARILARKKGKFDESPVHFEVQFSNHSESREISRSLSYIKGENEVFTEKLPQSNVNEALILFDNFPVINEISNATVNDFWKMLIYHVKKREDDRHVFENAEENLDRTKRDLKEEFDAKHPDVKAELREIWDKILSSAQLYFDSDAKSPVQLNDNLEAFIKRQTNDEIIPYNQLSTGIKNFIFQLGHVFAVHFNRQIDNAFLLADEPAQGLFPDFIYDLVETYERIVGENTQIFMATHNPIIASQFEPFERFILEFDEAGYVVAHRGVAPIGDDPNDILHDDFKVDSLMPKQGVKQWERYKRLRQKIADLKAMKPTNGEAEKLEKLYSEAADLRLKYNFSL